MIRTLLIWLMVLALSAQRAVAATMVSCGPNHHGGVTATGAQEAASADQSQPRSPAQISRGHHDMAAQADQADSASAASRESSQGSDAVQQKCSACASCCSIGAILSPLLAVLAPVFSPAVFSAVAFTVDAFAADGPDRPPRIVLA